MQVSFVRSAGNPDRIYVHRSDGSETSWTFPTYGDHLPHDLVHLVVEDAFGLRFGFWGRVDAGVDPQRVNAEANRLGGKDKYAGFGAEHEMLLQAEALANLPWADPDVTDAKRLQSFADACQNAGVTLPAEAREQRFAETRRRLDELRGQWRTLLPKGTLKLDFPPHSPTGR